MVKRYEGNTGRVTRLQDPEPSGPVSAAAPPPPVHRPAPMPNPLGNLSRFFPQGLDSLETEDLILMLILYLLYRESGDREWLMILGGMLF